MVGGGVYVLKLIVRFFVGSEGIGSHVKKIDCFEVGLDFDVKSDRFKDLDDLFSLDVSLSCSCVSQYH